MIFESRRVEVWEMGEGDEQYEKQIIKEAFHEANSWEVAISKALKLMARNIYKPYLESIELISGELLKKPKYMKVLMKP